MNGSKDSLSVPMENLARLRRRLIAISSLLTCGVLVVLLALMWWTSTQATHDSDVATLDDLVFNTRVNIDDFSGSSTVQEALEREEQERTQSLTDEQWHPSGHGVDSRIERTRMFARQPFIFMRMQDGSIRFLTSPPLGSDILGETVDKVDGGDIEALVEEVTGIRESSGPNLPAQTIKLGTRTWMWTTYVASLNPDDDAVDSEGTWFNVQSSRRSSLLKPCVRSRAINSSWRSSSSESNIWLSESVKVCSAIFLSAISSHIDSFSRVAALFVPR